MRENCDQLIDYFNGLLTKDEEKAFEQHLQTCTDCREELEELREATANLPFSVDPVEPPSEMKDRVLANVFASTESDSDEEVTSTEPTSIVAPVEQESKQTNEEPENELASRYTQKQKTIKPWMVTSLAAALLLSVIGNIYSVVTPPESQPPVISQESIDEVLAKVDLSGETNAKATASIIKQQENLTLVVNADQLQNLQGDEVYQVWLLEGDKPHRAGSFVTNQNGEGAVAFSLKKLQNKQNWDAIAITKEPDAKSQTPEGEILLSSKL